VVRAAFVMMVFVTIAGELLAPPLYTYADRFKAVAEGNDTGLSALQHVWIRQKNRFIHIGKVIDKRHIESVTQYRFKPNHRLDQVITAPNAVYVNGIWRLASSRITQIGKDRISTTSQKNHQLRLNFDPRLIQMSQQEPAKTSVIKLVKTIRYRHGYGLNSDEYAYALWQRIIQPVTTLVMIFLGVPFIFGSLRNVTMGFRITMGILIGFGFYMLNQLFGPISMVYQFPPWLAAILPTIMFALAGWALMRKSI
jgi:lipopolysaccharide export system permease protein